MTPRDRIESSSAPEPNTGCWLWARWCGRDGYARISIKNRTRLAHRVAFESFRGPIPQGMIIDHLCRTRCCVNPDHLEVVSMKENLRRGYGACAMNARKTHCKNGHPFDEKNTYFTTTGRLCRRCRADCEIRRRRRIEADLA